MDENAAWEDSWGEAIGFFTYELFLSTVARLLDLELHELVATLLARRYSIPQSKGNIYGDTSSFRIFYITSEILGRYNDTQERRYKDYQSVLLQRRASHLSISFDKLVQTDVLLAARSIVKEDDFWYPRLLYFREMRPSLPLFARSEERSEFLKLAKLLGITDKNHLERTIAPKLEQTNHLSPWWNAKLVVQLMNIPKLDTRT